MDPTQLSTSTPKNPSLPPQTATEYIANNLSGMTNEETSSHARALQPSGGQHPDERGNVRFPLELWEIILKHVVCQKDLARVARVSRVLRSEAERALYHTVSLGRDESFLRTLCFCRAVQQCSRRAASVKALRLDVSAAIIPTSDEPVLPLLINALRAITHVERLELRVFADWFLSACLEGNVLNLHFPALKSLVIDLPPHSTVLNFIEANATIEDLTIETPLAETGLHIWSSHTATRPITLPHLRKFDCRNRAFLSVLHLPSLTHLWMPDYVLHELPVIADQFGRTLVSLRLGLPRMQLGRPLQWTLNDVAAKFPCLRCLQMDEWQAIARLSGRGFSWDSEPGPLTLSCTKRLTLVWVAMWRIAQEDPTDYIRASAIPVAESLLRKWSPYLSRIVFWYDHSYEETYTSFATDEGGELAVTHDKDLPRDHWREV
ncbi:hypothetical protein GY45DRAFT_1430078 [Cubamyces sp. BRFM 1775]|nr:hypothetical protein GY45DRAFT_1430078 [Cubamyces sp. BRFM 1775]